MLALRTRFGGLLRGGVAAGLLVSCAGPINDPGPPLHVLYTGSSTVAVFLQDAEEVYGRLRFELDTAPESAGGEAAILEGRTELAGIADTPSEAVLLAGVETTLIGHDAIALIVHPDNPVRDLTQVQLAAVFTGEIRNWKELGGEDLAIRPLIVSQDSATYQVFRRTVLGGQDYAGCESVRPDPEMVPLVAADPAAIGTISFSFLNPDSTPRPLSIEGQPAAVTNFDYPIKRPLFLLHRSSSTALNAFADWALSETGQRVLMRHFVGMRPVASFSAAAPASARGSLVVYTETRAVYDGGIEYYPHLPYEVLTSTGDCIRHVANHRGDNDERPTRVVLPVGTYLIRTRLRSGEELEFYVHIEAGRKVEVDVADLKGDH